MKFNRFTKKFIIFFAFIFSCALGSMSLSAETNENSKPQITNVSDEIDDNFVYSFLGLLSKVGPKLTSSMKPGEGCWAAKIECGTLGCCSKWVDPYLKKHKAAQDKCSSICNNLESYCKPGQCPKGWGAACDAGCGYKDQCRDLCPCIKEHCS
ncbi:hypothetical protein Bealeia1_01235 [Candidatus Bealeia paramacronuclearis]|uniref:Uncharacterized protein n=1 Tax=Candidatus Bealeia paramacronuclearis TaxID=1921001 RepID=A0ABZ2C4R2_9PROT|nr:hypothetical protein [Candidatus Bealeia paramacronuclearis]